MILIRFGKKCKKKQCCKHEECFLYKPIECPPKCGCDPCGCKHDKCQKEQYYMVKKVKCIKKCCDPCKCKKSYKCKDDCEWKEIKCPPKCGCDPCGHKCCDDEHCYLLKEFKKCCDPCGKPYCVVKERCFVWKEVECPPKKKKKCGCLFGKKRSKCCEKCFVWKEIKCPEKCYHEPECGHKDGFEFEDGIGYDQGYQEGYDARYEYGDFEDGYVGEQEYYPEGEYAGGQEYYPEDGYDEQQEYYPQDAFGDPEQYYYKPWS